MNIYNKIEELDYKDTFFYNPIINKLTCYKLFYKIAHNINNFIINTLIIEVNMKNLEIHKENNNYKVTIDIDNEFLTKFKMYELNVLNNIHNLIKKPYVLYSNKYLLNNKLVYMYNYNPENIKLCIKISGIWESDNQYGLIVKLFNYPSTVKY